ncbi:MAG TPA: asparagine synthase C-terminal domain-containing protein, partial [Edaphobacter sp.]|uniref:asparagine synthase C-terminal domain-containing protein n=1 Tax=Edaphobacter sp. TaxID=1934404 RepID=UPI002CEDB953
LYYELRREVLVWATHLEPFFAVAGEHDLDETFAAAFLSSQAIGDLTPYKNIHAVSPAHYFVIREGQVIREPHWEWMVRNRFSYDSDAEYDEQFFHLFQHAVERRTGPGAPVLAELSGGIDSSSIVCMSDYDRKAKGATPADLIDTISYYDDSEPNWNEKPYFTVVEEARGKIGTHIDVSSQSSTFEPPAAQYLWPGPDGRTLLAEQQLEDQVSPKGYRAVLSGIGGDELLGGPPDPLPELADYLVSLQFRTLLRQSFSWGLAKRVPLLYLVRDATAFIVQMYTWRSRVALVFPVWLSDSARRIAARREIQRLSGQRIGLLPSTIDSGLTWWSIMETLYRPVKRLLARREYRYPFLDRDLVDFLLRVPMNQLKRPGRRRLLMRRALRHIVPIEVLERKRKAYVTRGPAIALAESKRQLLSLMTHSQLQEHKHINELTLQSALASFNALSDKDSHGHMMRAIQLELWIRRQASNRGLSRFCSQEKEQ